MGHSRLEFIVFALGVTVAIINALYYRKQSFTSYTTNWIQNDFNLFQFGVASNHKVIILLIVLSSFFLMGYFYWFQACGAFRRKDKIQLRKFADCGSWCTSLLPIVFAVSFISFGQVCSLVYLRAELMSFGLLLASFSFIFFYIEKSYINQLNIFYLTYFLHIPLTATFLWKFATVSMLSAIFISFICHWIFYTLVLSLPLRFKLSFSFGEAVLVAQGTTLFLTSSLFCLLPKITGLSLGGNMSCSNISDTTKFLQVLLLGCALAVSLLYMFPYLRLHYMFYILWFAVGSILYPTWWIHMNKNPVLWLFKFVRGTPTRIILMTYWITFTVIAIFIVTWQNNKSTPKASTIVRKYFHGLVILVYVPGLMWDVDLLYLASGVALAVFIFLECIRLLFVPPLGKIIHSAFSVFLDEKDSGNLILTHIYLLVGCSSPLWVFPMDFKNEMFHIATFSGILSLGVGDTAASIGGTLWGCRKWPGTKKTLEGTVCAIIAQFFASLPFFFCVNTPLSLEMLWFVFLATSLTAILEAVTKQIDNLVLPLFLFMMLISIK